MTAIPLRRSLLPLVVLLCAAGPGCAMGLLQIYDAAVQNDPVYRSALAENQAGQQYKAIGRAGLLPTIQYNYGNSTNKAQTTQPDSLGLPVTTNPDYKSISSSISLRQPLFNLDTLARYKQGIAQTNFSDAQLSSRQQDLMIRLLTAYTDVTYAQDQLALFVAQHDTLGEQRRANDRMFEKGEGSKTDMLETEAKLDIAAAQLIEAEDGVTIARATLAAMVGQEVKVLDVLGADFEVPLAALPVFEDWKSTAIANNAELAAGHYSVETAEQEINKSKAGHAPRLDLNLSYSRSSADTLATYRQDSTIRSIGITLVVPLYSGGLVNAVSRQAVANRDKAQSDLDTVTSRVMVELRKQFNATQNGGAKLAALKKAVMSSTLLLHATRQSVLGGARINLDVLNAEQQLVAAKRDMAQARYNYLISFLKLRVAAGTLKFDDLRTVAAYFSAPL